MNKDLLRIVIIAGALLLGLGIATHFYRESQVAQQREAGGTLANDPRLERSHSHSQGPRDAPVTVVEFLDPECEACRAMYPLVKRIQRDFDGKIRLVIRYMPLHANSEYAAGALEAAAEQGRYWELLELLFVTQPSWGDHQNPRPELIRQYAEEMGLDMEAFDRFLERGLYKDWVEVDHADGKALGVRGTPSFFVNGRPLRHLGYEDLKALIEDELDG